MAGRSKWYNKTAELPKIDRQAYANASPFLQRLKIHRDILTFQQWKTLRGQALAGDIDGAERGLRTIIKRWRETGRGD